MADTKITSLLTPQVTTNPATDVLPIVNIADTLMASSGSTRKITVNSLLGAGGTATLASATITGDLTVDTSTLKVDSTNDVVLIGSATKATYGANKLEVRGASISDASLGANNTGNLAILTTDSQAIDTGGVLSLGGGFNGTTPYMFAGIAGRKETATNAIAQGYLQLFTTNVSNGVTERYRIAGDGVHTWRNVGGVAGTAMTLNSTGLGVGGSVTNKLTLTNTAGVGSVSFLSTGTTTSYNIGQFSNSGGSLYFGVDNSGGTFFTNSTAYSSIIGSSNSTNLNLITNSIVRAIFDTSGNVGIGVTPSVRLHALTASLIGARFESTSVSNSSLIDFKDASTTSTAKVMVGSKGDSLQLYSGGNVSATLDSSSNLILQSSATPATLTTNGQLTVNATSNTNLRFSYRGSDGTTRVANITLA